MKHEDLFPILLLAGVLAGAGAQAVTPLTVDACRSMKTAALQKQCLLSAVDAPPSVTGKTYSTQDIQPRGPVWIDQSAPATPVVPYVNVNPESRPGARPPR